MIRISERNDLKNITKRMRLPRSEEPQPESTHRDLMNTGSESLIDQASDSDSETKTQTQIHRLRFRFRLRLEDPKTARDCFL